MYCVLGPVPNAHLFLSTNYKVGISIIPNFRLKYLGTDRLSTLPKGKWQSQDSNLGS